VAYAYGQQPVPMGSHVYPKEFKNYEKLPELRDSIGPWMEVPIGVESLYRIARLHPNEVKPDRVRAIYEADTGKIKVVLALQKTLPALSPQSTAAWRHKRWVCTDDRAKAQQYFI
jgi:hypothetical protein